MIMKRIISILVLAAAMAFNAAAAEKTLTFNVGKVEGLHVSSSLMMVYEVHVTHGKSNTVEVVYDTKIEEVIEKFDSHLKVEHSSANSVLYLGMHELPAKLERLKLTSKARTVKVFVEMTDIHRIDISGANVIYFDGAFECKNLEIDLTGSANFANELNVTGNSINIDCSGATYTSVNGNFKQAEIDGSGACSINLTGNIEEFECDLTGASKLIYHGESDKCDLECSGATNAELVGKGDDLIIDASGACKIEAKDYCAKYVDIELNGACSAKVQATHELKHDVSIASKLTYFNDAKIIDKADNSNVKKGTL